MCTDGVGSLREPEAAESRLASLMQREMNVAIDPKMLRLFLLHHWSKVTKLAHEVHEASHE